MLYKVSVTPMRNRLGILYKIKWSNTCFKLKCEERPPLDQMFFRPDTNVFYKKWPLRLRN